MRGRFYLGFLCFCIGASAGFETWAIATERKVTALIWFVLLVLNANNLRLALRARAAARAAAVSLSRAAAMAAAGSFLTPTSSQILSASAIFLSPASLQILSGYKRREVWPEEEEEEEEEEEIAVYPEVTYAFRVWTVVYDSRDPTHGPRLAPLVVSGAWLPRRRMEASCTAAGMMGRSPGLSYRPAHQAPARDCGCGIWALKSEWEPSPVIAVLRPGAVGHVSGKVALWGRVLEYALGYRAQYAYPYELYAYHNDPRLPLLRALAGIYAVDLHIRAVDLHIQEHF